VTSVHIDTTPYVSHTDKPEDVVQVAFRHPNGSGTELNGVTPVPLQTSRKYYLEIVRESDGGDDQLVMT